MSISSFWFMVLFISSISLMIYFLFMSIIEKGVLKFSIYCTFLILSVFALYILNLSVAYILMIVIYSQ